MANPATPAPQQTNPVLAAFDAYEDRFDRWLDGGDPGELVAGWDAYREFESLQGNRAAA
jgi:hypothetical protein